MNSSIVDETPDCLTQDTFTWSPELLCRRIVCCNDHVLVVSNQPDATPYSFLRDLVAPEGSFRFLNCGKNPLENDPDSVSELTGKHFLWIDSLVLTQYVLARQNPTNGISATRIVVPILFDDEANFFAVLQQLVRADIQTAVVFASQVRRCDATLQWADITEQAGWTSIDEIRKGKAEAPSLPILIIWSAQEGGLVPNALRLPASDVGFTRLAADEEGRRKQRWAGSHDKEEFLDLFHRSFGEPMDVRLWAWKYSHADRHGVFALENGAPVAYIGGLPRAFSLGDLALSGVQLCDSMVVPEQRGVLRKKSPFQMAGNAFLRTNVGENGVFDFGFGFPSKRAGGLGKRLGLYRFSSAMLGAIWLCEGSGISHDRVDVREIKGLDDEVLAVLWKQMVGALPGYLIPMKNASFLNWRYLQHPINQYRIYEVRAKSVDPRLGILVLKMAGPTDCLELMDLICQPEAAKDCVMAALQLAAEGGFPGVNAWVSQSLLSYLPQPNHLSDVCEIHIDPAASDRLAERWYNEWWLMGGDTDFK